MSIWGLTWPWARKTGRTIESYDKIGRLRVLCVGGGSPATGDFAFDINKDGGRSKWTRCPECNQSARVTGSKAKPRLGVHIAVKPR